eukprot:UN24803
MIQWHTVVHCCHLHLRMLRQSMCGACFSFHPFFSRPSTRTPILYVPSLIRVFHHFICPLVLT